jgi:cyclopropane-fatty-acyl-phospholipid synthase
MTTGHGGATREAIQLHYDANNEFYKLWLDPSMTYSSALWDHGNEDLDLHEAQLNKLDYHAREARIGAGDRILDIGCGWGSGLRRFVETHGAASAHGLTLSAAQLAHIEAVPGVSAELCHWRDHHPEHTYTGIVSIGAFEHFVEPGLSRSDKVEGYRSFFRYCRDQLEPRGFVSLQTIAYGNMRPEEANTFIQNEIFPLSELPFPAEIFEATEGLFEIEGYRNDRRDYGRTCAIWYERLHDRRCEAVAMMGQETVDRFAKYLKLSYLGFHMRKLLLLRLTLRSLGKSK